MKESEGNYSCSCWAMTRGSSFLMSCGYHWATFSPMSFLRKTLCADLCAVGLRTCPNILARASATPWVIAAAKMFFKPPFAAIVCVHRDGRGWRWFCKKGERKKITPWWLFPYWSHKIGPLSQPTSLFGPPVASSHCLFLFEKKQLFYYF